MLGLVVNTGPTPIVASATLIMPPEVNMHMAYVAQQQLYGYSKVTQHVINCKTAFDRKVMRKGGEMTFENGQLLQVYQNDLAGSFSMAKKIQAMWTGPWRVIE